MNTIPVAMSQALGKVGLSVATVLMIGRIHAQDLYAETNTLNTAGSSATTGVVSAVRDPFWPVGYRPKPKEPTVASIPTVPPDHQTTKPATIPTVAKAEPRWPTLRLRGIVKNAQGGYIAMVEPFGMVQLGQVLELKRDGFVYRWKVSAITEKGATCSPLDVKAQ